MQILDDIWSSIKGNAKTRISDPILGTFICSWVLCNWDKLALLFWGDGSAHQRINAFSFYLSSIKILGQSGFTILWLPLGLTIFYLFLFPWISLKVKELQRNVKEKQHQQAVDIDIVKAVQQEKLNKAKLRANPDKKFLEQIVQLEQDVKYC